MKIIIGLGNPGSEFTHTRHNLGSRLIDYIARKFNLKFSDIELNLVADFLKDEEKYIISKPKTFMNESGKAVSLLKKYYKLNENDIYIAFDDLDIKEGEFKIQKGKYPKSHNGIKDINRYLDLQKLNFIRIGIENRTKETKKLISGNTFVLSKTNYNFSDVFEKVLKKLEII